jgi:general stress protein 26
MAMVVQAELTMELGLAYWHSMSMNWYEKSPELPHLCAVTLSGASRDRWRNLDSPARGF